MKKRKRRIENDSEVPFSPAKIEGTRKLDAKLSSNPGPGVVVTLWDVVAMAFCEAVGMH